MRQAAEKAKRELDGQKETDVQLPFIAASKTGAMHLNVRVSRANVRGRRVARARWIDRIEADGAQFEGMVQGLLDKTLGPCKKCLKDANVKKSDIKEVLLVGGMTRMPKVAEIVEKEFEKKPSKVRSSTCCMCATYVHVWVPSGSNLARRV